MTEKARLYVAQQLALAEGIQWRNRSERQQRRLLKLADAAAHAFLQIGGRLPLDPLSPEERARQPKEGE